MVSTSNYLSLPSRMHFPLLELLPPVHLKHDIYTHCLPKTSEYNFVQRECFHLNSASHLKCKNAIFLGLPVRMLISWSKSWGFHIPLLPEMRELVARRAARGSWSCAEWIRWTGNGRPCLPRREARRAGAAGGWAASREGRGRLEATSGLRVGGREAGWVLRLLFVPLCDLTMCW